jgi:hypothetical protein
MTRRQARSIEWAIIGLCLAALGFVFQPFSLTLYGVGAGLVVFAGLAFNLVPHCVPGRPARSVARVALIVLIVFVVVTAIAIGSAYLYVLYLGLK